MPGGERGHEGHRVQLGVLAVIGLALLLTRAVFGLGSTEFGVAVSVFGLFVATVIAVERWRPSGEEGE
jgi:hypothetical protein